MITVRLMGGLGNQMFQYAVGRAIALRRGTRLELDLGWFRHEGNRVATQRFFELGCFTLDARLTEIPERAFRSWERNPRRAKLLRRRTIVREPDGRLRFDPAVLEAPDRTLLIGYWQSEKYFAEIAGIIRGEFEFRSPVTGTNAELAAEIGNATNTVSVHVRRGDYVTEGATHGTLPLDYYKRATEFVAGRIDAPTLVVFSDDPTWTRNSLRFEHPTLYVDGNDGHGCEDLQLMVLCRHHVIANSSFSWWGAWLASAPDKIVVAPNRWFARADYDTYDLVPEGWKRL